jgi:hypothetical protein
MTNPLVPLASNDLFERTQWNAGFPSVETSKRGGHPTFNHQNNKSI